MHTKGNPLQEGVMKQMGSRRGNQASSLPGCNRTHTCTPSLGRTSESASPPGTSRAQPRAKIFRHTDRPSLAGLVRHSPQAFPALRFELDPGCRARVLLQTVRRGWVKHVNAIHLGTLFPYLEPLPLVKHCCSHHLGPTARPM
jgi:hypothetical protein